MAKTEIDIDSFSQDKTETRRVTSRYGETKTTTRLILHFHRHTSDNSDTLWQVDHFKIAVCDKLTVLVTGEIDYMTSFLCIEGIVHSYVVNVSYVSGKNTCNLRNLFICMNWYGISMIKPEMDMQL